MPSFAPPHNGRGAGAGLLLLLSYWTRSTPSFAPPHNGRRAGAELLLLLYCSPTAAQTQRLNDSSLPRCLLPTGLGRAEEEGQSLLLRSSAAALVVAGQDGLQQQLALACNG